MSRKPSISERLRALPVGRAVRITPALGDLGSVRAKAYAMAGERFSIARVRTAGRLDFTITRLAPETAYSADDDKTGSIISNGRSDR